MNVSKEIKRTEAIKRMKALGLFGPCIKAFEKRDEVQLSEPTGGLYEFHDDDWLNDVVKRVESEFNCLVYHVIHSYTNVGQMYNLLVVSDYEEEWVMDNADIPDGIVFCWVENADIPDFSEFDSISVEVKFGGLVRRF